MEQLKASVEKDGSLTFDKVLELKDRLLYLFLLCEQAKIVLSEVRVSCETFEKDKEYLKKFKKQIKLNHLGTELISDPNLESNDLVLKIKI